MNTQRFCHQPIRVRLNTYSPLNCDQCCCVCVTVFFCVASNTLCVATNTLCVVTNTLCVVTNTLCVVTNTLCVVTNTLCVVTNTLCVVTNTLCVVTNTLCVVTNTLCVVTNTLCVVTGATGDLNASSLEQSDTDTDTDVRGTWCEVWAVNRCTGGLPTQLCHFLLLHSHWSTGLYAG